MVMVPQVLSHDDRRALITSVVGLPVSLAWKGYGSAIFLELGVLGSSSGKRRHRSGAACIAIEWDWRLEKEAAVVFGSSDSGPAIQAGLGTLTDAVVEDICVVGQVPELTVKFSDGRALRSMVMTAEDPQWTVRVPDGRWVYARGGTVEVGDGTAPALEDDRAFALADEAARRWGTPSVEPRRGSCMHCQYFVPLDGEGQLLDYGCCASSGPLDGQVIHRESGCPNFTDKG